MATLLMVESWLHSTGLCLPPIIRRLGHEYVLLTKDRKLYTSTGDGRPHPVVAEASEIVVVDTNDLDAVLDIATTLASRRNIDGVLTTCDYYLETVAAVAASLGLPGARPEVMRRANQKHLVRAALDAAGVPNPAFAVVDEWQQTREAAARIGTPLIAKPVDLNAGTAVELIDDDAALKDAFWAVAGFEHNTRGQPLQRLLLLEEQLQGQEVSVESVTFAGTTTVVGTTDKSITAPPACVESGHMFPARLGVEVIREVEAFVRDVLAAIGYTHGLSHTEVMITRDGPRLVEMNPRQGGGYIFDLVHLVTGTHPLEMLVELALGRMPRIGDTPAAARTPEAGDTGAVSAAVFFVMSPRDGVVERVSGVELLEADPYVHRWAMPMPAAVRRPRDNDAYLGHVLVVDPDGAGSRAHAEKVVGNLRLHFDDGDVRAPLGVPSGL
ncbi:ATP-grasp domain-containing protein [Phytoactinopolyspora endophytica]|uniref:ATP-grasp domain-containing protein n=1 Tax=Phytoactinopolyspora endophytica TaxID=1642495 RepID=UPI0013EA445C|nr:ATP-grasp domain-containing protein [Phytoactinopolyspora endophytica]